MDQSTDNTPTIFTVFGATGDLSQNKLFPALYDLYTAGRLPDTYRILGTARRDASDAAFRQYIRDNIALDSPDELDGFLSSVYYEPGDVTDTGTYERLYERIAAFDDNLGICTAKLFYLAISPRFFADIIDNFARSSLMDLCESDESWTRMLVEKPYGTDLQTAKALDDKFCSVFKSEQLYRIDHYLGKSALQNILAFRFFNGLFAGSWNHEHIAAVHLQLLEASDVSGRGSFYDQIGAFRDVGQNHLLQMLALLTMDSPEDLSPDQIRSQRAELMENLVTFTDQEQLQGNLVLGQYDEYTETEGVDHGSDTETYFLLRTQIDNNIWKNVPVYLESGKALAEKCVRARIFFSQPTDLHINNDTETTNELIIEFQPEPHFRFNVFVDDADLGFHLDEQDVSILCRSQDNLPAAYESVLHHAIAGDQTIFASEDEIKASWAFTMPIVNNLSSLDVQSYNRHSSGPEARNQLLAVSN